MTAASEKPVAEIGGIRWDAPVFKGARLDVLTEIVDALSSASYHYADDSGKEWGTGHERVTKVARLINDHGLEFYAIQCLHRHTPQLVGLDAVVDAVLADLRGRAK